MGSEFVRYERSIGEFIKKYPITSCMMIVSIMVHLIGWFLFFVSFEAQNLYVSSLLLEREVFLSGEWWRIGTAAFTHGGLFHLVSNLVGFMIFGPFVEKRLKTWRYGLFVIWSILFTGAMVIIEGNPTVGASGIVFAILGFCLVYSFKYGNAMQKGDKKMVQMFIAINVVITFIMPQISISGHMGGLCAGIICALIFYKKPKSQRKMDKREFYGDRGFTEFDA